MNPSSENPKSHWKDLAAELGFEPSEPESPPEAEEKREPAASEPSQAPDVFAESSEGVNPFAPDYEEDALFSDDEGPEELAAEAPEPEPEAAPAVDEVAAAEAESAAAAEADRSHWRELLGDLGLEAPPEPEPRSEPVAEASTARAPAAELRPDRIRESKKSSGKRSAAPSPPAGPFGGGLFSEEEEKAFPREARPIARERVREEAEAEAPETREEPVSDAPAEAELAPRHETEEPAEPRKRGRRRTRSWKRLHTTSEVTEEEAEVMEGEREVVEAAEEMGVADDLFGDLDDDIAAEAAAESEEGEPSGEEEERRPRRRRRRRSRRGDKPSRERVEAAEDGEPGDEEEVPAVSDFADDLFADEPDEEEEREEAPRRGRRRRRPAAARQEAAEVDEDEEELDAGGEPRPVHRKIPTWEEAVSVVVELNMEARARSPGGGRRRR